MSRMLSFSTAICVSLAGCGTPPTNPHVSDPSRFTYTRLYCTPDNESHFETITADLAKVDTAPPAPHFFAKGSPASRMAIAGFDARWGESDLKERSFHPAPSPQYVVYLEGSMSISSSDGETRQFKPGDVLRVEDTAPCKGHISVAGERPAFTLISR